MSDVPAHLLQAIRKASPDFDFRRRWREYPDFPSGEIARKVASEIEQRCEVRTGIEYEGNYDTCYRVHFTDSRDGVPSSEREHTREAEVDYVIGRGGVVYDGQLQISTLGPFAALSWFEIQASRASGIHVYTGGIQKKLAPTPSCAALQRCVEGVIADNAVELVSWETLDTPVPGMRGHPLDSRPRPPTVYDCLFSELR